MIGRLCKNIFFLSRPIIPSGAKFLFAFLVLLLCSRQYSYALIAPGVIDVNQTICYGTAPATITNTISASGTGTLTYFWQQSTLAPFSGYSNIPSAHSSTYSPGILNLTTWFRRAVTNGTDSAYSDPVKITVTSGTKNTITSDQTICSGSTPTTLSGTLLDPFISYLWLSSTTSATSGFAPASGTNNTQGYAPGSLTQNTWYKRRVSNGPCIPDTSAAVMITVAPVSVGGTVAGGGTFCQGPGYTFQTLSGYTGTILKWQSSTTSDFSSGITDISFTSTPYPATTTQLSMLYYRAIVKSSVCPPETSSISPSPVTVIPQTVAGQVTGGTTVCIPFNSTTLSLTGYTGNIIKWQSSLSNDFSSGVTDINNTTSSLTVTNLTVKTFYRAFVQNGSCALFFSGKDSISIAPSVHGGIISGGNTVCAGTNNTVLILSGYTGTISNWEWSTSRDFSTGINNIAHTTNTYTVTNLSGTRYYRAVVVSPTCAPYPSDYSTIDSIIVIPQVSGGTISGGATVCSGINSTLLTLSAYSGSIVKWESSPSPSFSAGVVTIANTSNTYTASNLTVTTYYRAIIHNNPCPADTSVIDSIVVVPETVGGSIAGGGGVCPGINSKVLTLTGHTGTILKWQSSTTSNFSTGVTDIANTTNTYTAINLSATTYFRAVLQNASCAIVNSSQVTINVQPPVVAGTLSGGSSYCSGTNTTTFNLTGYVGGIVRWESCALSDFSSGVTQIANNTNSLNIVNQNTTTYYRALVSNSITCPGRYSTIDSIVILPLSAGGVVSGNNDTVCEGVNSTTFTLSGYTGSIQWQSSTTAATTGFSDIGGAHSATYTATNLSIKTYFRAIVTSGICLPGISSVDSVLINPLSEGGIVSGNNDSVCVGSNSTVLTLSGYSGSLQWQASTTSSTSGFSDIAGAYSATYTAINLSAKTYFRAIVSNGICPSAISIVYSVLMNPLSIGGIVSGNNDTVCIGSNSTTFTLSGYTGSIQWQASTTSATSGFSDIAGAQSSTYTATNLSVKTYFRAIVSNGICSSAISIVDSVLTIPVPVGGMASASNDTVCFGINSTTLTLIGYSGTIQWQASTTSATSGFSDIAGAYSSTYTATNLSVKTYFRAILTNHGCTPDTSAVDSVGVNPPILNNTITGNTRFCYGSVPGILSGSVPSGGNGSAYSFLWISSELGPDTGLTAATGTNNTQDYTPGTLTKNTWFRRIVFSGPCSVDTSNIILDSLNISITYTVPPIPLSVVYGNAPILPPTALVTYANSISEMRPVIWDTTGYHTDTGSYQYHGTILLAPGTCNPANLEATLLITIHPRIVIVKADPKHKRYNTADPVLTYVVVSGSLIGADTFSGTLTRVAGENTGKYPIHQNTLSLPPHYTLIYIEDSLVITPDTINLSVSKTTPDLFAFAGDSVSYTIRITNNGPDSLSAGQVITIIDQPLPGLTIGTCSTSNGTFNSHTNMLTLNSTFAAGGLIELSIRARIAPDYAGDSIGNIVSVQLPHTVFNPGDSCDSVFISTTRIIDLAIRKTADRTECQPSDTITYSIIVTNNGAGSLYPNERITIHELLPDSFTTIAFTPLRPAGSSYDQHTGLFTLGDLLLPGDSIVLTLKGNIHEHYIQSFITNSVTVKVPPGITDPDSTNDSSGITLPVNTPASDSAITASDQVVCKGNHAITTVSSTGIGNPVYTWYADSLLTIQINNTTTLDTLLQVTTSFFITVKGDNRLKSTPATAKKITIFVHDYASDTLIVTHDTIVCYGKPAILIANTKGSITHPVFTWYALPSLTDPISTGDTLHTTGLTTDTSFYVTIKGTDLCESRKLHLVRIVIDKNCGNVRLGLAKALSQTFSQNDGSIDLVFNFTAGNYGDEPIVDVRLKDDLKPVFPTATIKILSLTTPGIWNLNQHYDGVNDIELLDTGNRFEVGDMQTVTLTINLLFPPQDTSTVFKNVAEIRGLSAVNGKPVNRKSNDGFDPNPDPDSLANDTSFEPTPIIIDIGNRPKPNPQEDTVSIFIPEGFSPNGDHENDYFVIENPDKFPLYVAIFNRWGNMLYENRSYDNSWDGKAQKGIILGEGVPDGTYFYIVEYTDGAGSKHKLAHSLTIVR